MTTTVLTIDSVAYSNVDRSDSRIHLDQFVCYSLGSGYESVAFSEVGVGPMPSFSRNDLVELTIDSTLRFTGRIVEQQWQQTAKGWTIGYTALGLKYLADRHVPITSASETGTAIYNRQPDDPEYVASDAGLSLGDIIERILTIQTTADALDAIGVGAYTSLSPPTLPSATTTDLSALTIVPTQTVILGGRGILNQLEALVVRWMPTYVLWVAPDGTIRISNVRSFTSRTLTVGTDPCLWPNVRASIDGCYSRVVIRGGAEVEPFLGSVADGTLAEGWSAGDESTWLLSSFEEPQDALSEGTLSSLTSTSVTVDPTDNTQTWTSNFWSTRQAWIYLYTDSANGVLYTEARPITSCGSLSAGGTASVSWSSSWPISSSSHTRYRIIGTVGGSIDVGRLFYIREPNGNVTGTSTWVGSHLVRRFPLPVAWANNDRVVPVLYPTGVIAWSSDGNKPYIEFPATLEVVPTLGAIRFTEPVVKPFADPTYLRTTGYPTSYTDGEPLDVRVILPYSKGALTAIAPSSSWEGTLYTADGIQATDYLDLESWILKSDQTSMEALAQQHLNAVKDTVYEGTLTYLGIPAWDVFTPGSKLNIAIAGSSSPWSSMAAPIVSCRIEWTGGQEVGALHTTTFQFSSRQRPFTADDLYTHPAFGSPTFAPATQEFADTLLNLGLEWGMEQGAWPRKGSGFLPGD